MIIKNEVKEVILKIMSLALSISPDNDDDVHIKPFVDVQYSPHAFLFSVSIYALGWNPGVGPTVRYDVYLDRDTCLSKLVYIHSILVGMLNVKREV